ncbi:rsec15 [Flagelloscypha sp. PMI_526]|nr:rsec15 [Flagelloscypha sp. PMI_526]
MPPRPRRAQFTQEQIDSQLQQIHLLDSASSSENLEQLGPIIKQIHSNHTQDAYLRTLRALVDSKDSEIERICSENYQDFISSVSTLFSVKAYTDKMKENIASLDSSVSQLGKGLVEKKRNLLQNKKTANNLDEAIDTIQACLRVLDVVNRVGEMIQQGKYWSALRSLDEIQNMPATSLSQTAFYQYLLSSLPSLRAQIKDAVSASMKQWLLEIRNVSGQVGQLALDAMDSRTRRWRTRREKDALLRNSKVGSAVELVTSEKTEFSPLDNENVRVDFRPLLECIHIYATMDSLEELQRSYQEDRKRQSELILPLPLPLSSLSSITEQILGYFIVETHVLETTGDFRSERDVEDLWDSLVANLRNGLENSLRMEADPDSFLKVKESLISFIIALPSPIFNKDAIHAYILALFEKYAGLLEAQFSRRFSDIVRQDDLVLMSVENANDLETVLEVVWISDAERRELRETTPPRTLPWSQTFYLSCQDVYSRFYSKFYAFVEGVTQHHRNIDELLSTSLDNLLKTHISEAINKRLTTTSNLLQLAPIVTNLEHFEVGCSELERSLTSLRSTGRGGSIRLEAQASFSSTLTKALGRITTLMTSKLDDFFELSEYDWTPKTREDAPSMYLYELFNWLTTLVDGLAIKESYKDEAYKGAVTYIAECLMEFLTGRNIPAMNENAVSNILVDVDFLESELRGIGRPHLGSVFEELHATTSIPLSDTVQEYLVPANRRTSFAAVKQKRLQALLEKLAKHGATLRDPEGRKWGEKRRKEADAVGRLFPDKG